MKYNLYQIILTEEVVEEINDSDNPLFIPMFKAFMDATTFADTSAAVGQKYYTLSATVEAQDLDDVFAIGNGEANGPVTKHDEKLRSIGIGDILVDEAGKAVVVAQFGFNEVDFAA